MKALEDLVGLPLIERVGDRFRPTAAGEEIASTLARIEALLSECGDALAELKEAGTGAVSIGVVSTAKYFAPRAIAAFRKERPRVEIRLLVGNREETVAALRNYEVDLAIMGRPPREFEVEAQVIVDIRRSSSRPRPPMTGASPSSPRRSWARPSSCARTVGHPYQFRGLPRRAHPGPPPREIVMASNETIKQAVMAGLGIAFISAHTVATEVESGRLAILNVEGLPIVRHCYMGRRTDKRLLPAALALRQFWATKGGKLLPKVPGITERTLVDGHCHFSRDAGGVAADDVEELLQFAELGATVAEGAVREGDLHPCALGAEAIQNDDRIHIAADST